MRPILDLYKILLEGYKKDQYFLWLCNQIEYHFQFSDEEKESLLFHFKLQKPSDYQYEEFFYDKRFKKNSSEWWGRHEKKARIEFLEAIIKKLEK